MICPRGPINANQYGNISPERLQQVKINHDTILNPGSALTGTEDLQWDIGGKVNIPADIEDMAEIRHRLR